MSLTAAVAAVEAGARLSQAESRAAFADVFSGVGDDAAIASLLRALHRRGETVSEILGAVDAAWAVRNPLPWVAPAGAVDTCGTGGDGLQTFNVSTTSALVAAAMGLQVVKHGNRAMSSSSGSADVLQALGISLEPSPDDALRLLTDKRFVFLYAPLYHPGFKRVAAIRKGLGHRSIFNLLGPLLNPAGIRRQVIGVFSPEWVEPVAHVLLARGVERALVVHGGLPSHGTDELTTWGESQLAEVDGGEVRLRRFVSPHSPDLSHVAGGDPAHNAQVLRAVLAGTAPSGALELVALNVAAAAWVAGGGTQPFEAGFAQALAFVRSGKAAAWWGS